MFEIDWTDLQLYHYLAIGGGGLALSALILYFLVPKGVKIPVGIIATVGGLVAGIGVGVIGMVAFGYETRKNDPVVSGVPPPGMGAPGMPGMPGMGMPGGKGKGKGKGGGGFGPNPKTQLASLVVKVQQLTEKPLTLTLSDEQRSTIREQLKGLGDAEELEDDDAKKRLDAILEVVENDHRPTLERAGYNWPGGAGGFPPPAPANPFKDGAAKDSLTALEARLANKK